ncbi:L-xylulose reductase-like [Gigantopelta aegis]|uniref:L-xylulose reductase-like n=1 Tax=Gigantopelta aegis TaxID=1735272 RepID=UPI001B88A120|nr:L-xylulose reductase-like [Gigantopelta aegis]
MEIKFDGKRALVTGAGKGIGRATAKALVKCGAETYALSRTQADLDSLKAEVPTIHTVCVDITDWDKLRGVVKTLCPIDLLVNNAGVCTLAPFLEVSKEDFDYTYDTNVKALINISQVVLKDIIDRGSSCAVVNVSSIASSIAVFNHIVYASSKAAVDMLTKIMTLELGSKNIRVNSVNPTVVMTDMGKRNNWSDPAKSGPVLALTPQGRFAEVHEVVDAILFLLSDKASMINGTCLPVDGGRLVQ